MGEREIVAVLEYDRKQYLVHMGWSHPDEDADDQEIERQKVEKRGERRGARGGAAQCNRPPDHKGQPRRCQHNRKAVVRPEAGDAEENKKRLGDWRLEIGDCARWRIS